MSKSTKNCDFIETGLSPNMEDYIETISILATKNKVVRVKDIAKSLNIKMPSVSSALNKLKDIELIDYEKYGFIELTKKGQTIADSIYKRHLCLSEFFESVLMLDSETADTEACKAEHDISPEAFRRLTIFLQFMKSEEKNGQDWILRLKQKMGN